MQIRQFPDYRLISQAAAAAFAAARLLHFGLRSRYPILFSYLIVSTIFYSLSSVLSVKSHVNCTSVAVSHRLEVSPSLKKELHAFQIGYFFMILPNTADYPFTLPIVSPHWQAVKKQRSITHNAQTHHDRPHLSRLVARRISQPRCMAAAGLCTGLRNVALS